MSMVTFFSWFPSPLGELLLTASEAGVTGLYFAVHRGVPLQPQNDWQRDERKLLATREQLIAYCAGELSKFDLPLAPNGTPFQLRVWHALQSIPYGETRTYGELAQQLGIPGAARAVGAANGQN